jgi:hypothetical protein
MTSAAHPNTRLQGRRLVAARALWLTISALALTFFVIALPARLATLKTPCNQTTCVPGQLSAEGLRALQQLGLSDDFYALYVIGMELTFVVVMGAVGAIIFWRKSDDGMAMLVSLALVVLGAVTGAPLDALMASGAMWRAPVAFMRALGASALALFFVFPNGRFVPRWSRLLVIPIIIWPVIVLFTPFDYPSLPALLVILVWLVVGAGAQI